MFNSKLKQSLPTLALLAVYWLAALAAPNAFRFLPHDIAGFVASFFFVLAFGTAYLFCKLLLKKYSTLGVVPKTKIKITSPRLIGVGLYFQVSLFLSLAFLMLRKTMQGELKDVLIFGVTGLQLHFFLTGLYLAGGIIFTYLVVATRKPTVIVKEH